MPETAAYQAELKRTREAVARAVALHWNDLPDYRDAQVQAFVEKITPIVLAGQEQAVALTDAYMSQVLGTEPLGLDYASLTGAAVRNGVPPEVVYARPFTTVWTSINKIGYAQAVTKGLNRLMSTADMDVAMSARDASVAYAQRSGRVAGFIRVAEGGCCDFCQRINGARVHSSTPAPLHNHCGCTVKPFEYGSPLASKSFTSFRSGSVFKDAAIHTHGEMGPMITNAANHFTSEGDLEG